MPLAGVIVARINLPGNKFLHSGKIAENNREKLHGEGKKVWNTDAINPIQRLITEREAVLTAKCSLLAPPPGCVSRVIFGKSP